MEGYMMNALGHWVPEAQVREIDKVRDGLVHKMVEGARMLEGHARKFREACFAQVSDLVELAAQEHGVAMGGEKGNLQLTSYDGRMKVVRANDSQITFTEGMTVARKMIFDCIGKWSEGADRNLAALVHKAFETDRQGHLSASKILGILSCKIEDADWMRAMDVIRNSIQMVGTKAYIRFYEKDEAGEFRQVALG
ncbi:MAG: DUF3164 family protein [Kiritimatiellaeota bacterium]|nr:DUF3164 family protein [Kiritimatiellota bacterium]